ncbi:MAG: tetratricopeptide repeat protein [Promethearchaeota archaeon]
MFGSEHKKLIQVEKFINEGKFNDALQIVEIFEKRKEITPIDHLTCQLLKSTILNKQGHFKTVLKLTEEILTESRNLGQPLQQIDTLLIKAEALWRLGKFDESFKTIEQGEQVFKKLPRKPSEKVARREALLLFQKGTIYRLRGDYDRALAHHEKALAIQKLTNNKIAIAESLDCLGLIYDLKGDLDQALEYHQQSLTLKETVGNKQSIAASLNNIGIIYYLKGDLDQALKNYEQSLTYFREIGNKHYIAAALTNIGIIYRIKGELERALENYQQSLDLRRDTANKQEIARLLSNIGMIYTQKDQWEEALEYHQRSLALQEEIGNNRDMAITLFQLIHMHLDKNSLDEAQHYLHRLDEINNQGENKAISQRLRLAKALMMKSSTRVRNKLKAAEFLEEIAEEEIIDHRLSIIALLSLCDLLLFELRISGDQEVLDELQARVTKLQEIAKRQHSHWLLAETYVLKSKLALLDLDIQGAQQFLDQAQLIAEKRGFQKLVIKILSEQASFRKQIDKWKLLSEQNASMTERSELAQLESLLLRIAHKKLKITEEEVLMYAQKAKRLVESWETRK